MKCKIKVIIVPVIVKREMIEKNYGTLALWPVLLLFVHKCKNLTQKFGKIWVKSIKDTLRSHNLL